MAAQQFLGVHRQQIAVEHGGRLQERFRQRQRRQFHRKAAGHQNAALDVIDAGLEMHVAGLRVRPGVEDRDHRAALPLLRRVAHLHRARAMAEGTEIVGRKPARAAQRFRSFFLVCHYGTCLGLIRSSHRMPRNFRRIKFRRAHASDRVCPRPCTWRPSPDIVLTRSSTLAPGSACARTQIQRNLCNLPLT